MAETTEQPRTTPNGIPTQEGRPVNGTAPKTTDTKPAKGEKGPIRRAIPFLIFGAILIAGAIYGWHIIQFNKVHEETDDAQIDADISPIIPRVSGYVTGVYVIENQPVDSGTVLVTLDTNDLGLRIKSAQAAIVNAQAAVRVAQASATAAHANVTTAEVNRGKTAEDLRRAQGLYSGNAITKEQLDAVKASAETAEAQVKAANDQASAAETQIAVAQSQVQQRMTDLDNAKLQLSYSTIVSPSRGTVAKKNVVIGEYIQSGTPLMAVAQSDLWISGNFKETQLQHLHPGQPVEFTVDSYPDSTFHGRVQSISPATGAKFSLLPPDNATGNFVKVTQRVPVRILVDRGDYSRTPLRPGMSVDVTVSTAK